MRLKTLKTEKLAGNIKDVTCSKSEKGYSCGIETKCDGFDIVTTERGEKRYFANAETLIKNMHKAGILSFRMIG